MKNFFGIIPARKGSKSIKNKNLVRIKKKKLIEHTLQSASRSKYLKKIIVSSDDIRILNISKKFKKIILHKRKKKISKSNSLLSEAINDVIVKFEDFIKPDDFIVLLQPTTPQRKTKDIDSAIKIFLKKYKKYNSLATISEPLNHPRELVIKKYNNFDLFLKRKKDLNRQKYFKSFFINGSIYISTVKSYKKNRTFFTKNIYYLMTNKKFSIDLNDSLEMKLIEKLI